MLEHTLLPALLKTAGALAMTYFRKVTPAWKANKTYITAADLEVQAYLKAELERHFPDDGLIGEENDLSKSPRAGDRYWVIDPIDGTAAFAAGFPVWGIAVGLLTPTAALGGWFYMPATGDFFATYPDGTVRRNDHVLSLKTPTPFFQESLVLTCVRFFQSAYKVAPDFPGKIRSLGSTIAHLCYVATGSADVVFLARSNAVWDLAAGWAMIVQNQGVLEYVDGTPVTFGELLTNRKPSQAMLAGHPETITQFKAFFARHIPDHVIS